MKNITKTELKKVKAPEFTETWHPVSHGHVVDAIDHGVKELGLDVKSQRFELNKNQANMFGSYRVQVSNGGNSTEPMIGFRNSTQKNFAVGVTAGLQVIVCSNMVFSGDYVEFRRHTKRLDLDELRELAKRAIEQVVNRTTEIDQWQNKLKAIETDDGSLKTMTYDVMAEKIVPASRFHEFVKCTQEEVELNGECLYSFYGGVTRVIRNDSIRNITQRSSAIMEFLNLRYGEVIEEVKL